MTTTAVLVATYNGEKLLKKQLDTIREQELKPDFVLFRDDRSTDNTVSFLKSYIEQYALENWIIKINEKNIGWRLNFRQLLVDTLDYDIDIAFFSDQDNIWHLDKNKHQVQVMEAHPEIELLSADIQVEKISEEVADLPRWFKYFEFNKEQVFSKYPPRFGYSSYRVGWVVAMRRSFIADIVKYWKPEYNITHDVLVAALSSLTETGYNLNEIVGTHLLHDRNATGDKLLTLSSPKQVHVEELYKFVGFYDVMYQVLQMRGSQYAPQVIAYYDFYVKRHAMARDNKFWGVFTQIFSDWKFYGGMSGRLRDVIFAFKK
ncbi:glycosyltransferase [Lactococcus garvieae]|uniref:Glycosyltransferase/ putative alpha-rhamnosyltransferase RhaT n=1 Tax=Lactococcus garvieae DCC43 TaxID=1231377 RepID=K2NXJ2_9LACT|nr:glycosyltransferase [Lactococcus garvieae]EKF52308.1 Glycosyltransferase/ putative alpha-rhamnosyltransferase RhaT [Lactococcus garvieae DCC43]